MRILVVEDEPRLAETMAVSLEGDGHTLVRAGSGRDALLALETTDPDLVVLDLGLPDMDGLGVLAHVRARRTELPVVIVSARVDVHERVRALDLGADDYLTKPFALEELLARVRSRLRAAGQARSNELVLGGVRIDVRSRRVHRDGVPVHLTAREYDLLVHLMRHGGQVLSRGQLLDGVWGRGYDLDSKVVDVYVGYLRRKLALEGRPDPIETVRHAGYRFRDDA